MWGYRRWLDDGCHGDMRFMEQHIDMRHDPSLLLPGARSVVSLLLGYKPSALMRGEAKIAQYAYGEDYHTKLKRMCYALAERLSDNCPGMDCKVCVDTVPIPDKLWAWRAGLGWIGRNTLFINPRLGSYCNIAEIVTTLECDRYDEPMENRCGDCRACVDACPNGAITLHDGLPSVDARRCTAYNTIENRDERLPDRLRRNGYAFGCDCCQLACPYNKTAKVGMEVSAELMAELESLKDADEARFNRFARHRALNRIKYWQWRRNISHKDPKTL